MNRVRSSRIFLLACLGIAGVLRGPAGHAAEAQRPLHWAFQPLRAVSPPADPSGWAANEIDRFVMAQLRERGLEPNPAADRRTLIRRAYFDLAGLPPSPEQVEAFIDDPSPAAYAKVVDALLASPRYGERWGRHWLDLARYADTSGDGADAPIPEARLYRDYVIDAFNQDLPYNQFIVEQIAGDLLAQTQPSARARDQAVATSFVALARRFNNSEYSDMHLVIDDTVATIGKSMLGLTLGCARCHDHKFDPISTRDYYGLYGYFSSTQYPHAGTEHGRARKNFVALPGGGVAYAVRDKADPKQINHAPILVKGQPGARGEIAPRSFLDCIDAADPAIPEGQSGRLELARWIASQTNPLTARVMANRIWQYHFGRGLVATSSDFGRQGTPPSHPELLDWLAGEFIRRGWSIKEMNRLILASRMYQLSSADASENLRADPANDTYWRYPRRRLEAEPMRDAVLAVSGRLRFGNPGSHPFPKPNEKNEYPFTQHHPFTEDYDHNYRAVYLPSRRLGKHPYLETFNGSNPNECTARRDVSTVPLQALFWMNSRFIQENASALAARLIRSAQPAPLRVQTSYRLAFGRAPEPAEVADALTYIAAYQTRLNDKPAAEQENLAWTSFCRILLASNEFIYVD